VVRGHTRNLYTSFFGAGVLAILFIVAQMVTWNHLQAGGFYLSSNPAVAFYYLLTGVHALHLIGGLWVWSKCAIRLTSGAEPEEVRLSIQLCTIYWHFLLLVWIVLFAILANT
jgi:cytochrome c oxidase subunit 3